MSFCDRADARSGFSDRILRRLYALSYAPNGMWAYILSTWFLANRDQEGGFDEQGPYGFLRLVTTRSYAYSLERPDVNVPRTPVYPELVSIVSHSPVTL